MKEKEITEIVKKFTKVMGPVADRVAKDVAKDLGILKDDSISPASVKEYESFISRLQAEYSKIIGKDVVGTIIKL